MKSDYAWIITATSPTQKNPVPMDSWDGSSPFPPSSDAFDFGPNWRDGLPFKAEPIAPFCAKVSRVPKSPYFRPIYTSPIFMMQEKLHGILSAAGVKSYRAYPVTLMKDGIPFPDESYVAFKMLSKKGGVPAVVTDPGMELLFLNDQYGLVVHESLLVKIKAEYPEIETGKVK